MTLALRSRPRALVLAFVLVILAGTFVVLAANPAQAQGTGAEATKDCPPATLEDPYTIGDTVDCTYTFTNEGFFPGTVTFMTEQQPFPGGPVTDVSCTLADGVTVINEGDTLPPGNTCTGTVTVTIPNDPALCNTAFRDRVEFELLYTQFGVTLTSGAFATHTLAVVCRPTITIEKSADTLGKVGDPVTYNFEVCNTGLVTVERDSVIDTLLGDITANFDATLAPDACDTVTLNRVVLAGDDDPLGNTVTATYSAGIQEATAQASAETNLFQPSISVTKNCAPDPIQVGQVEACTIVITNTSSADTPLLENAVITDTLSGNLLDPTNTAVASSTCTATLAVASSCTIVTNRTVLDTDVSPIVNTVNVAYNPDGFTNVIPGTATDSVTIQPVGGEGCTPGFWKQSQHFDSWTTYSPDDSFEDVFGVDITIRDKDGTINTDPTLLEALNALGGGQNALARHAVAALLNAASPDVDSEFTTAQVIALVQGAFASGDFTTAKDLLAAANEAGCPLS